MVFLIPQDYWTKEITNKSITYTSAVSGERRKKNKVGVGRAKQRQIRIFVEGSHCFSEETSPLSEMGNRKYAKFPLGLYIGGGVDSSIMFVSVHVGATSALLCAREGKSIPMMAKVHFLLYTTTMTLNVSQYGFCI